MNYKALLVRLEKRFEHNYMFMMSYTLASTKGTVNNIGPSSTVTDSAHLEYDNGPNNSDRRHALVASGSFLLPADVTVGAVFTARSTMPFSAIAGVDLNGDAAITDYVPGTTRNVFNRGNDAQVMALVNAYRATNNRAGSAGVADQHERVLRPRHAREQGDPAHFESEARSDRPGLQPAEQDEPAAAWQTNALSPAFGAIASAANMRQAEVAVRFTF